MTEKDPIERWRTILTTSTEIALKEGADPEELADMYRDHADACELLVLYPALHKRLYEDGESLTVPEMQDMID